MEILHSRCAALDVSKRDAKVCVRVPGKRAGTFANTVTTWGATTNQVLALREYLLEQQVTLVVMEATGVYWKPFYFLLEDGLTVMLVNARQARNMPGRKTDVSDSQWLAELGAHGLIRASFVPPEPVRQLRDLTRLRSALIAERGRQVQRLEKLLEDAGIKLSSVATDIMGVSGRAMLAALIAGVSDPAVMAEMAKGRMRTKLPALTEALTGRFREHHAFLSRLHLAQIDQLTASIGELTDRIEVVIEPFRDQLKLLITIPGIQRLVADVIIAETGADMSVFPTAGHLASWAGTTPGHNESAGRSKSSRTRPGNPHLKQALGIAAMAASRANGTYLQAFFKRIAARRGYLKAMVATEHSMLVAVWHMLTNNAVYTDLGGTYFSGLDPQKAVRQALRRLEQLGYTATLTPIDAAA